MKKKKTLILLKAPHPLIKLWNEAKEPGQLLGILEKSGKAFKIFPESGLGEACADKEYKIVEADAKTYASFLVFSGSSRRENRMGEVVGEISKVWNLQAMEGVKSLRAHFTKKRAEYVKDRLKNKVETVTSKESEEQELLSRKRILAQKDADARAKKQRRVLKVKESKEKVEEMLIKLFEDQEHYSFKQLQIRTNQPSDYLRGILKDMCIRQTSGPNHNLYALDKNKYGDVLRK
eukprot:CAMPEP_0185254476 /NCGR_PEP_ID=MMETSP1359-20130426/3276_1 /TAXON_ID=552665 /ORGANISM="Bigelowiella longifila, Strain CCMP242" /LENGTH=233 /DNA_ID=CAMNT_0027837521 /DNA_START=15 /DNA_END=716 /DNA_ORIENTATION=+